MTQQAVHGNLSHAMRDNYAEHGVDEYYRKVASSYRNPFLPGIKKVVWTFMTRWWQAEGRHLYAGEVGGGLRILDMAAGSGEATLCLLEWETAGRSRSDAKAELPPVAPPKPDGPNATVAANRGPFIPPNARRAAQTRTLFETGPPDLPKHFSLNIEATDPFTAPAYETRTSRPCHALSFADLADARLPADADAPRQPDAQGIVYDLVICSFALHLLTDPSELFALLYELSTKVRWLVIVAPHKKPEIKDGWGWERWDLKNWQRAGESVFGGGGGGGKGLKGGGKDDDVELETELEIVRDKVKLRLHRSVNVEHPAHD